MTGAARRRRARGLTSPSSPGCCRSQRRADHAYPTPSSRVVPVRPAHSWRCLARLTAGRGPVDADADVYKRRREHFRYGREHLWDRATNIARRPLDSGRRPRDRLDVGAVRVHSLLTRVERFVTMLAHDERTTPVKDDDDGSAAVESSCRRSRLALVPLTGIGANE